MNLPVIGYPHMSCYRLTIHFYLIGCADNNVMTFVVRFPNGLGCRMLMSLGFSDVRSMLLYI